MVGKAEFRGALATLGGLLAVILAITSITPGLPGELLLQTLRFHMVGLGLVLALAMALFGAWRRALLLLVVLAVAFAHGAYFLYEFQARRDVPAGTQQAEMTLLNFNVLARNPRGDEVAAFIIDTAPDVALIMETPGIARHLAEIEKTLPYRIGCRRAETCDLSLFSRHPITGGGIYPLPPFNRERLIIAPISIDGVAVTVVGIHLSKPYFDEASVQELDHLREVVLRNMSGPVVLAGDFNAAPWSSPLRRLGLSLDLVAGPTYPATWPVELGALGVPLDNILTKGDARILEIAAGEDSFGSNHRYLLARIGLYASP